MISAKRLQELRGYWEKHGWFSWNSEISLEVLNGLEAALKVVAVLKDIQKATDEFTRGGEYGGDPMALWIYEKATRALAPFSPREEGEIE